MKIPAAGDIAGSSWRWCAGKGAQDDFWRLTDTLCNREWCRLGGAVLNELPEEGAVAVKFRRHSRNDGTLAELETVSGYPFGGEAEVARRIAVRDGFLDVCVDVKPGRGEIVQRLELDVLRFPGVWKSLEIVPEPPVAGEVSDRLLTVECAGEGVVWEAERPPLLMLLSDDDGGRLELGAGDDLWRLDNPGGGCRPRCTIVRDADGALALHREVLNWSDDVAPERRPWRFRYYIAWSDGRKREALGDFREIALAELPIPPEGRCGNAENGPVCWKSPAARKILRKMLRREAASGEKCHLSLSVAPPAVCGSAAHLERPRRGTLAHWQLTEMVEFHDWAARQLGNRRFRMAFPERSLWSGLPSGLYLWNTPPGRAELRGE